MNRNILISYIYDFLYLFFEESKYQINKIILFGSTVRGDFDKESDIDLFMEPINKEDIKGIEDSLRIIIKRFEVIKERNWKLKSIDLPIKCIVGNLGDEKWSNLREEIISNGLLLYGKYEELPKKLDQFILINYSLQKLSSKRKMQLLRKLFGYRSKKNKKIYEKRGLLDSIGGYKLYSNIILVPFLHLKEIRDLFNNFKIKIEVREVWIRVAS